MGCYAVAKRLQRDRVPTLSGDKKSNGWNKSRILAIVRSDAPLGVLHTHKRAADGKTRIPYERIEGYYPVIVEQTIANQARAMIDARRFGGTGAGRKGRVYSNLLTGIAFCQCGASMFLSNRLESRNKGGWLKCSNAVREHNCNNTTGISYPKLEESVLRDVRWIDAVGRHLPKHDPTHQIMEQLASKEAEAVRLDDTISALVNSFGKDFPPAIAKQIKLRADRRTELDTEIQQLRQQLSTLDEQPQDLWDVKGEIITQMQLGTPDERYEARVKVASALKKMIAAVRCYSDRTVRIEFPTLDLSPTPRLAISGDGVKVVAERVVFDVDKVGGDEYEPVIHDERLEGFVRASVQNTVKLNFSVTYDPNFRTKILVSAPSGLDTSYDLEGWVAPAEIAAEIREKVSM